MIIEFLTCLEWIFINGLEVMGRKGLRGVIIGNICW